MELAMQLQHLQLDLDLQWIPTQQNDEADALTNEDFMMFSSERRIEVNVEELEFRILPKVLVLAEDIDREIVQKKASKIQSSYQDPAKKLRLSQPW